MKNCLMSKIGITIIVLIVFSYFAGCGGGGSTGGTAYYGSGSSSSGPSVSSVSNLTNSGQSLRAGDWCQVNGSGFGSTQKSTEGSVSFTDGTAAQAATLYYSWTDTVIVCRVPDGVPTTNVTVVVRTLLGTSSNSMSITINPTPNPSPQPTPPIASPSPSVSSSPNPDISPSPSVSPSGQKVTGTVLDSKTSKAIQGASAAITYTPSKSIFTFFRASGRTVTITETTDSTGTFTINGIPAGSQSITVSCTGYTSVTQAITVVTGTTTLAPISLTPEDNTGSVKGTVTDSATGLGIPGASITIGTSVGTTDSTGSYTIGGIDAGSQTVAATKNNYRDYSGTVTVITGASVEKNFTLTGKSWATGEVTDSVGLTTAGFAPASAVDGNGNIAFAYSDNSSPKNLKFSYLYNGIWYTDTVYSATVASHVLENISLAFDSTGYPAISFCHFSAAGASGASLIYTRRDSLPAGDTATWSTAAIEAHFAGANATASQDYNSLAFGTNDVPYISYFSTTTSATVGALKLASKTGGSWTKNSVDNVTITTATGLYTSLAFDPDGNPAIAYYDNATTILRLKYALLSGGTWNISTVSGTSNVCSYNSLVFTSSGAAQIGCFEATSNDVVLYQQNGSFWNRTVIEDGAAAYTNISVALDPTGVPCLAYRNNSNQVKYARVTDSSSISIETLPTYLASSVAALRFNGNDNPYIGYVCTTSPYAVKVSEKK